MGRCCPLAYPIHPQAIPLQTHIHNAALAGGVVVGAPSNLIHYPWLAMVLGFLAGMISIGGVKYLQVRSWAANTCCFGLMPRSRPLDHGGPSRIAMGCIRHWRAAPQFSFRAWMRDPSKLDGAFAKIWGASNRTCSSLLRNKGDLL